MKSIIILILNVSFYALCDAKYIPLIGFNIIFTWLVYCRIKNSDNPSGIWLVSGIGVELCFLLFFKYVGFFVQDQVSALTILMPLGISYYTFKMISFLVDGYMKRLTCEVSLLDYAVYVSFFPQIMCGPISRADDMISQLNGDCRITEEKVLNGLGLVLSGAFKKFVIADRLAGYTAAIFSNPNGYPSLANWIAAFFFSVQIYCDFAGYSELAIGVGNLLGFTCSPNFKLPYLSSNIKEFWGKWHISLSTWLRDYVYIPLGGSRKGKMRKNLNLIITFLVSGIWHGSGLNFICWGLLHGILNIFAWKRSDNKLILFLQYVATFGCVTIGWILFNVPSMSDGIRYIANMFHGLNIRYDTIVSSIMPFTGDYSCLAYFITVCIFIAVLFLLEMKDDRKADGKCSGGISARSFFYLTAIILFAVVGKSSFLYANF